MIEELQQPVPKAFNIQKPTGFDLNTKLRPGKNLREFFQRAETAGKGNEGVREISHHGFALVHGLDGMQFGESAVTDLPLNQAARHDANRFATVAQNRIGNNAHQANATTAKDQTNAALRQKLTQTLCSVRIRWANSGRRATEDANPH